MSAWDQSSAQALFSTETSAFRSPAKRLWYVLAHTMDERQLRELFLRIGQGDGGAEREVYNALFQRVRGIAHVRGLRGADLDDLIQDVLSAVVEQLRRGRFLDQSAPSTWVIAILNNKVVDYFRKRGRSDGLMTRAADQVDFLTARSRRGDQERRAEVMQALARLTPTERFVLTSTELAGLTYDEVADRLKCPAGTVASTKNRAVRKVREFFTAPNRRQLKGGPDGDV